MMLIGDLESADKDDNRYFDKVKTVDKDVNDVFFPGGF